MRQPRRRREGASHGAACITLLNQKGGVGKTSTCHHLAGTLARMGRRVLLMDNDPQSSPHPGPLGPDATRDLDPAETIDAIYHSGADPRRRSSGRPASQGIDLIPGNEMVTEYNNAAAPPDGPPRSPVRPPRGRRRGPRAGTT